LLRVQYKNNNPYRHLFLFLLFKFTNTYGEKVHRLMAEKGYAPELFKVCVLKPNWKVVIMDYKNNLIPVTKNDASQIGIAICFLHGNNYVHGDLRSNNIFKCDGKITIIDFDWSGTENEVRYPLWINCEIEWPTGVRCGALITKQHDTYWIEKLAL
jgi:serine/threonine protein kinase